VASIAASEVAEGSEMSTVGTSSTPVMLP